MIIDEMAKASKKLSYKKADMDTPPVGTDVVFVILKTERTQTDIKFVYLLGILGTTLAMANHPEFSALWGKVWNDVGVINPKPTFADDYKWEARITIAKDTVAADTFFSTLRSSIEEKVKNVNVEETFTLVV